ncbi:MAG: hypothetical protein WCL50_18840 [Spirochaetota bacterium]
MIDRRRPFLPLRDYVVVPLAYVLSVVSAIGAFDAKLGRDPQAIMGLFVNDFNVTGNMVQCHKGLTEIRQGQVWVEGRCLQEPELRGWAGASLQFDTGAIWPGNWNHVFMQSYHEINYQYLTGTSAGDIWIYEGSGNRVDGFAYSSTTLIGYQIPLVLSRVLVMLSTSARITGADSSTMASGGWGSDYLYLSPGIVATLTFGNGFSVDTVVQAERVLNFTSPAKVAFYERRVKVGEPTKWRFYRVVLAFTAKLQP